MPPRAYLRRCTDAGPVVRSDHASAVRTIVRHDDGPGAGRAPPSGHTNVAKHSGADSAAVRVWVDDSVLHVEVRDDGVGEARRDGSGLLGLYDRLTALGGRLRVESPPGVGTSIAATLPLQRR